jgi:N6-L-threonylcarbamoyladenine synthase
LRKRLNDKKKSGWQVSIPKFSYCTDNAAMIAMAGKFSFEAGIRADQSVSAQARLAW